ncbi:MAG: hypothetical protein K6E95_03710 [Lachnospiraceae bacterium]|nr:hypothetical protein [Lachnospiraceae bacterium]
MNPNKIFKIITGVFVITAILALIFGVISLVNEFGGNDKTENVETKQTVNNSNEKLSPLGEDEAIKREESSETDPSDSKKNNSEQVNPENKSSDAASENTGSKSNTEGENGKTKQEDDKKTNGDNNASSGNEGSGNNGEVTAEGLPIGKNVPVEELKFDGTETHFVLQNINYQVNVRKEASKSSEKVGEFLKGSYGIVLEKGEEFSLVKCGDLTGYVINNYLLTGRAADEQIQGVSSRKVRIDRAVYIRDDANMESNKLAIAAEGAVYSLDPTAPEVYGWVAIVYNDAPKAYVSASFCTVE